MSLKGKDGGSWKEASAVYGKSGGAWLYAKSVWARKDGTWQRAWTDCRKYDAGGRDWSSSSSSTVVTCSSCDCGTNTRTDTTTTYTKTGCPNDVRSTTGTCSGCTSLTYPGAGTYTTSDGVTATYRVESDWLGYSSYLVPSSCQQCSNRCSPCSNDSLRGYSISYCSATGVYTRTDLGCFKSIVSC